MKWKGEDEEYLSLLALNQLNLNFHPNLAVRSQYYGFCWGLTEESFFRCSNGGMFWIQWIPPKVYPTVVRHLLPPL